MSLTYIPPVVQPHLLINSITAEVQLEVLLRNICRVAKCQQMFPAGKKFFITLYKANESFLFTSQDPAAHQNVIFQMTDCTIDVPVVELTDDLKEKEKRLPSTKGSVTALPTSIIVQSTFIQMTLC